MVFIWLNQPNQIETVLLEQFLYTINNDSDIHKLYQSMFIIVFLNWNSEVHQYVSRVCWTQNIIFEMLYIALTANDSPEMEDEIQKILCSIPLVF